MPFYKVDKNGFPIGKAMPYGEAMGLGKLLESLNQMVIHEDLGCSCGGVMILQPIHQKGTFWCPPQYHECQQCLRKIYLTDIVDTVIDTEMEFEEAFESYEMALITIPESMNISVINMKPQGTRRYNLKREPFSPELAEYILELFRRHIARKLNIQEFNSMRDLWQV